MLVKQAIFLCSQKKVRQDQYTQHNPIPSEYFKIMFLNITHKKPDDHHRYGKCHCHPDNEYGPFRPAECKARFQKLQQACPEHYRNGKEKSKLSRNGPGYAQKQSPDNCCAGTGCAGKYGGNQLPDSYDKSHLISDL